VNKDCRQLARSRQFSAIVLNCKNKVWHVLLALVEEGRERHSPTNHGKTLLPSLGARFRRIIIRPDYRDKQERNEHLITQGLLTTEEIESRLYDQPEPLDEMFVEIYACYFKF
jgi:hypothetical protein